MVPQPPPPPVHHHPSLTAPLSPASAAAALSTFLESSSTKPHLHPDSLLRSTAIEFSAVSGPTGGIALHHLRRIEAGLRGERLVAETAEELEKLFGDGGSGDERLDGLIDETNARIWGDGKKRKRGRDEIEQWANDTSSLAGYGDNNGARAPQELESFANTPMHVSDWQDQEEYELQQGTIMGEVGERGAHVVKQGGIVPELLTHDGQGNAEAEKQAKREAKKRRKLEERQSKAKLAGGMG